MIKYSEVLCKLAYGYPDESAEDIRLPGDRKEDTLPYMPDPTDSGSNAFTGTAPVSSDGSNTSPSSKATPSDPYAPVGDSWQPSVEPQYPSDRSALNNLKGRMDSKNPEPDVHRPDDATNAEWYGRYASKTEPWRLRQAQDLERKAKSGRTDFDYDTVSAYQDRAAQRRMEITGKSDTELGIERRRRAQEEWKGMQQWDEHANNIINGSMDYNTFSQLSRADQDSVLRRVKQQARRYGQFMRYSGMAQQATPRTGVGQGGGGQSVPANHITAVNGRRAGYGVAGGTDSARSSMPQSSPSQPRQYKVPIINVKQPSYVLS